MAMSLSSDQSSVDHSFNSPSGLQILISLGDITAAVAEGIVVPEGKSFGNLGFVAKALIDIDSEFAEKRDKLILEKKASFKLGQVYTTRLKKRFKYVLHAILSPCRKDEDVTEWAKQMIMLYQRIFQEADKNTISVLAVPLMGSGKGKAAVEVAIEVAITSATQYKAKELKTVMFVSKDKNIVAHMASKCKHECEGRPITEGSVSVSGNSRPLPPIPHNSTHSKNRSKVTTQGLSVQAAGRPLPTPPCQDKKTNPKKGKTNTSSSDTVAERSPTMSSTLGSFENPGEKTCTKHATGASNKQTNSRRKGRREKETEKDKSNTKADVTIGKENISQASDLSAETINTSDSERENKKQKKMKKDKKNQKDFITSEQDMPKSEDKAGAEVKETRTRKSLDTKNETTESTGSDELHDTRQQGVPSNGWKETEVNPQDKTRLKRDEHQYRKKKTNSHDVVDDDNDDDSSHSKYEGTKLSGNNIGSKKAAQRVKKRNGKKGIESDVPQDSDNQNNQNEILPKSQREKSNVNKPENEEHISALIEVSMPSGKNNMTTPTEESRQCKDASVSNKSETNVDADMTCSGQSTINESKGARPKQKKERKRSKKDKVKGEQVEIITQNCPICLEDLVDPKTLDKCGHVFCRDCIDDSFSHFKPVCPSCNMVYGVLTGNQPEGNMDVGFSGDHLPGYEGHGTITITYYFPSGTQEGMHPRPGKRYKGTTRQAYLPDCKEGKEILRLLKTAFDRKLTFTIGRSVTTGKENVVTWNDIHHKTNMDGGPTRFGYPDPTYLSRVREELASKGVSK